MEQALNLNTTAQAEAAPTTALQQKDAVYQYALEALDLDASTERNVPLKNLVTKEVRKTIRVKLFNGIRNGAVDFKPTKTDGELKKYCSSLINNWLKKDERFN